MGRTLVLAAALLAALGAPAVPAEPLKSLASVQGVRDNPLIGYGLVVGLDGSGDQTQQTPFATQSVANMLTQLGISLPPSAGQMQLKNVAAVMVTASLPPFAAPGQTIDVTVSSVGSAKSLRGGTLLMTPLKGADGAVYAVAQGNLVIGGAGASASGSSVQVNQLSAGRIPGGATVERSVPTALAEGDLLTLELRQADFGTAQRAVEAIDRSFGAGTALAQDARVIRVRAPAGAGAQVAFLARLEAVDVTPAPAVAKVIVNARTGSVVMNQAVRVQDCAVAHGNLSVVVSSQPAVSQPGPLSGGRTVESRTAQIAVSQEGGALQGVRGGASLAGVIKGLNALGANPQDLVSILQAMKAAGALRAELEVI
ncbi:flagellar basal body P-ring protein FlgI [Ramlibacter tataouinensis]|uniref:flagellar basal body P-ring protein FlgI n=1 Tax=Ramlibacter tataouinensis TaxID=94132 RepID=UPI0022F3BC26|nr:flagellar basal body P-ring protein FlgI [Ramlibacter tataouinensis]WBY00597.1 flagellar basal body P-ring protein FlgI [Ramlibacter tataouinensis]